LEVGALVLQIHLLVVADQIPFSHQLQVRGVAAALVIPLLPSQVVREAAAEVCQRVH
jgi:hypothetical protein